jgi:hypothetical protein
MSAEPANYYGVIAGRFFLEDVTMIAAHHSCALQWYGDDQRLAEHCDQKGLRTPVQLHGILGVAQNNQCKNRVV